MKNKFYQFSQNNSGGSFVKQPEKGIAEYVIIEAESYGLANKKAEEIGLYFDGCDSGIDCNCCGDRWYALSSYENGNNAPELYGQPVESYKPLFSRESAAVHYADGTFKMFDFKK